MLEILIYSAIWLLASCIIALGLGGLISRMAGDTSDERERRNADFLNTDEVEGEELLGG